MKIYVNAIPPDGMVLEEQLSAASLNLETEHVHYNSGVNIKARVYKQKDMVTANCRIEATSRQTCGRCLREFDFSFEKSEVFYYKLTGAHYIELEDSIKDEILLGYPVKALCEPGCKGLCSGCGRNLNEAACACKDKAGCGR